MSEGPPDAFFAELRELVSSAALSLAGVVDILRADQVRRWRAGQRRQAEVYLAAFPNVADSPDHALALIWGEALLRWEADDEPRPAEYLTRFPQHAEALLARFSVHKLSVGSTGNFPPIPVPIGGPGMLSSIPGYSIQGELGRGGMGVVYLAHDARLNRRIALKQLLPWSANDPEARRRFSIECEVVASLNHPHIAAIYASGEEAGQPWFIMEYVEGGSLEKALVAGPQDPMESARLIRLLARAVHHAHQKGIIHRDLKPANVLLAPPADEPALNSAWGCPKVSDFGLARRLDAQGDTASGALVGTLAYMAPEQAEGRKDAIGPAADVYALGGILYRLLTGRVPFDSGSMRAMLDCIVKDPPEPPTRYAPEVPAALEAICLRCLSKAPAQRYPSAAALADDLLNFPTGPAVRVQEAPEPPRAKEHGLMRSRTWALMAAVGGIVVLGLGLWLFFLARGRESPAEPTDLFQANSEWEGPFRFDNANKGTMSVTVTERTGKDFRATYFTNPGNYGWHIAGTVSQGQVRWGFTEPIKRTAGDVGLVGNGSVEGTLAGDRITGRFDDRRDKTMATFSLQLKK